MHLSTRQFTLSTRIMLIADDWTSLAKRTRPSSRMSLHLHLRPSSRHVSGYYGFIFRTQTLAAKQARVGFSINVDDITWDGEGILRRWPGYVNFSKVIFGGCN